MQTWWLWHPTQHASHRTVDAMFTLYNFGYSTRLRLREARSRVHYFFSACICIEWCGSVCVDNTDVSAPRGRRLHTQTHTQSVTAATAVLRGSGVASEKWRTCSWSSTHSSRPRSAVQVLRCPPPRCWRRCWSWCCWQQCPPSCTASPSKATPSGTGTGPGRRWWTTARGRWW